MTLETAKKFAAATSEASHKGGVVWKVASLLLILASSS